MLQYHPQGRSSPELHPEYKCSVGNIREISSSLKNKKDELSDLTLCPHERDQLKPECLQINCTECGTHHIQDHFKPLINLNLQTEIQWCKWEYIKISKKGKDQRCLSCVTKLTDLKTFLDDLEKAMVEFPAHLFRAHWQQRKLAKCLQQLDTDEAMMVN